MALLAVLGFGSACAAATPTHTLRGVLVDVQSRSLQQLDSFTVRADDGRELTFTPAATFNSGVTSGESHSMTPGHMRQHMALADPITVTYRDDGAGHLLALAATD